MGWLVVVGDNDMHTNGGAWLWEADTNYWFWDGTPFPASFRLYPPDTNAPTWDPATNDRQTTYGPFDTSGTVSPHATGAWHKITRYPSGGSPADIGYLCRDSGDQYWYETDQNSYFTLSAGDYLQFTSQSTAPTTSMYEVVDAL